MKNSLPDNDICSIIIIPMSQLDMHGFVWDTDVLQNEKRPLVWDMWFTQGVLLLLGLLKDFHSLFYCTERNGLLTALSLFLTGNLVTLTTNEQAFEGILQMLSNES